MSMIGGINYRYGILLGRNDSRISRRLTIKELLE
jgi:hypothetical protein